MRCYKGVLWRYLYAPVLKNDLLRSDGQGRACGGVRWAFWKSVPLILKERKTWGNRSWFSIRHSQPSHILPLPFPHKTSRKTCKEKAYVGRRRPAFNFCTSYSTQCHTMHRMQISQGTLDNTSNKSAHTCTKKGGPANMTGLENHMQVKLPVKRWCKGDSWKKIFRKKGVAEAVFRWSREFDFHFRAGFIWFSLSCWKW